MASTARGYPRPKSGPPRPSEIEMSDDEESEDEATRLQREEEEEGRQERALSRLHGEAVEGRGEKRPQTAEEIEAEYERKVKNAKRAPRPKLTVDMMTGVDGLLRIPDEFKRIQFRGDKTVSSAAAYSLRLVEAYKKFCFDLMPSMAFEDVLLKIEKEGGSRQLKDFMQNMRHSQRNRFVEALYGREKTEQFLADLAVLMAEHETAEFEAYQDAPDAAPLNTDDSMDAAAPSGLTDPPSHPNGSESGHDDLRNAFNASRSVSPPRNSVPKPDVEEEEQEFDFDEEEEPKSADHNAGPSDDVSAGVASQKMKKRRFVLEDSSDEEENAESDGVGKATVGKDAVDRDGSKDTDADDESASGSKAGDDTKNFNETTAGGDLKTGVEGEKEQVLRNEDDKNASPGSPEMENLQERDEETVHGSSESEDLMTETNEPHSSNESTAELETEDPQSERTSVMSSPAHDFDSSTTGSPLAHPTLAQTQPFGESQSLPSSTNEETATTMGDGLTMQTLSSEDLQEF